MNEKNDFDFRFPSGKSRVHCYITFTSYDHENWCDAWGKSSFRNIFHMQHSRTALHQNGFEDDSAFEPFQWIHIPYKDSIHKGDFRSPSHAKFCHFYLQNGVQYSSVHLTSCVCQWHRWWLHLQRYRHLNQKFRSRHQCCYVQRLNSWRFSFRMHLEYQHSLQLITCKSIRKNDH